MLKPFLTFLNQHDLLAQRALLAVSGGLDSVVLAHLAQQAGLSFGIAHANFGLRDAESEGDEAFVRQLAADYGVPFFTQKFDTAAEAQARGLSIQQTARRLRYDWFEHVLDREGFAYLATAHHRDDALETLLLNLTRGAGLAGLSGIPERTGRVARPLLGVGRADLEAYAQANALPWREDRSNASDDYPRNYLRHQVLPLLRELNPNLSHTAAQSLEQLRAARRWLDHAVALFQKTACQWHEGAFFIETEPLRQAPEPLLLLHEVLRPLGFRYGQSAAVWAAAGGPAGRQFFSKTHTLSTDRGRLVVLRNEQAAPIFFIEKEALTLETPQFSLDFSWLENPETPPPLPTDARTALFDADALAFPLTLRPWQAGDWFCPLGMEGKRKKISDLLIDLRLPRPLKSRVWVLVSGGQIAWVVGLRPDDRFRVRDETHRFFSAQINPSPPGF